VSACTCTVCGVCVSSSLPRCFREMWTWVRCQAAKKPTKLTGIEGRLRRIYVTLQSLSRGFDGRRRARAFLLVGQLFCVRKKKNRGTPHHISDSGHVWSSRTLRHVLHDSSSAISRIDFSFQKKRKTGPSFFPTTKPHGFVGKSGIVSNLI